MTKIEEEIAYEIKEVMRILNTPYMPTSKNMRNLGKPGIAAKIEKTGGYKFWANKLGLENKSPTLTWDDEKIEDGIRQVMDILKIQRMPSRSEIVSVTKDNRLTNKIAKTYGFKGWSEKLNIPMKYSETILGEGYEGYCYNLLKSMGYKVEDTSTLAPYDLILNGKVRIDVKSGCAYELRGSRCHTFNLEKRFPACDIYIIYALNEDASKVEKQLIIPASHLNIVTLSIGENSRYDKYLDRFDYIDKYIKFYNELN